MPVRRCLAIALLVLSLGSCTADDVPTPVEQPLATPQGPSQTAAEAKRDGVPKAVAAMTLDERIDLAGDAGEGPTSITTDEGVWRLGRPRVTGQDYGEILLLDGRRERILKAFPLWWPPYELASTKDAIYAARAGDGAIPDTHIVRIDRASHDVTGRVYWCFDDCVDDVPRPTPPAGWRVHDGYLAIYDLEADDENVWAKDHHEGDTWTRLDPVTLEVVERGTKRPSSNRPTPE